MNPLHLVELDAFVTLPFATFAADPLLVCESEGRANAMTIGWGGLGTLWGLPVTTTYVRTSRFTHQLMARSASYSICWLDASQADAIRLCGTASGRDRDKLAEAGLTLAHTEEGVPYVAEATTVMACRKLHMAPLDMLAFCQDGLHDRWYQCGTPNTPHVQVIGEVLSVLDRA